MTNPSAPLSDDLSDEVNPEGTGIMGELSGFLRGLITPPTNAGVGHMAEVHIRPRSILEYEPPGLKIYPGSAITIVSDKPIEPGPSRQVIRAMARRGRKGISTKFRLIPSR